MQRLSALTAAATLAVAATTCASVAALPQALPRSTSLAQAAGYAADPVSWAVWWSFHRDGYLALKDALWTPDAQTGSDQFFLGHGAHSGLAPSRRPTAEELESDVVPLLLSLLHTERDDDIHTATLMALAKIGRGTSHGYEPQIEAALVEFLKSPSQDVAETATIALGILGRTNSLSLLADLLGDTPAGRERIGEREVGDRTQSFAAFGLGLIGFATEREDLRRFVVGKLLRALEIDESATEDLQVACVVALGLVPLRVQETPPAGPDGTLFPSASRQGQLAALEVLFDDSSLDPLVRAHVPVTLVRLLGERAEDSTPWPNRGAWRARAIALAERGLAAASKERDEVRSGCTIALGMLGDNDADNLDLRARELLEAEIEVGSQQSRRLALIALGQIAGRAGNGPGPTSTDAIRALLLKQLSRAKTPLRPWAGISLALLERGRIRRGEVASADVLDALRGSLRKALSPEEAGGLAIAVGLASDLESRSILETKIAIIKQDDVRGFASISLGLLRAHEASGTLRDLAQKSRYRPGLLRDSAVGLGLLGDPQIATDLVAMLRNARAQYSQAAITCALGFVGDRNSLPALLALVRDAQLSTTARAFGVAALGVIGDREPLPWNYPIARDLNYAARTATLSNSAATGILDLL